MKKVLFLSFFLTSTHTFAEQVPNPVVEAIQRDTIAWMKKNGWSKKSAQNKNRDLSHSGSSLNHNHHNNYGNNSAWYSVGSDDIKQFQHNADQRRIQSSATHSMHSILSQPPKTPNLNSFDDVSDAESFVDNTAELRKLKEKHEKELAAYQKHIQQLEQKIEQHTETSNALLEKHEKQLQNNEKEIQKYQKELTCYKELDTAQKDHIEKMTDSINELEQMIKSLKQRNKEKDSTIEAYAKEQYTLTQKLRETKYQTEEFVAECEKTIVDFQTKPYDHDRVPLLTTPVIIQNTNHIKKWISVACEELTKQHDYLKKFTLALKNVASEDHVQEAMKHLANKYTEDQNALQERYAECFENTKKELRDTNTQLVEAKQKNKHLEDENNMLRNQIAKLEHDKTNYLAEYAKHIQNLQNNTLNLTNELEKKAHLENAEWNEKLLSLTEKNSQLIEDLHAKNQECGDVNRTLEEYKKQFAEIIGNLKTEHAKEIE